MKKFLFLFGVVVVTWTSLFGCAYPYKLYDLHGNLFSGFFSEQFGVARSEKRVLDSRELDPKYMFEYCSINSTHDIILTPEEKEVLRPYLDVWKLEWFGDHEVSNEIKRERLQLLRRKTLESQRRAKEKGGMDHVVRLLDSVLEKIAQMLTVKYPVSRVIGTAIGVHQRSSLRRGFTVAAPLASSVESGVAEDTDVPPAPSYSPPRPPEVTTASSTSSVESGVAEDADIPPAPSYSPPRPPEVTTASLTSSVESGLIGRL
jgi:hypothetical protein